MKLLAKTSGYLYKLYFIAALICLLACSTAIGFPGESSCNPLSLVRLEIPFQLNGQSAWLSITVSYKPSTGEVVSASSAVFGNTGNTTWSNYVNPVASYETNQMTVIINMQYKTSTQTGNTYRATGTGNGEVAGKRISVDFSNKHGPQTAMTQIGIVFAETTIDLKTGYGLGFIQLDGTQGAKSEYSLVPKQ